MDTLERSNIPDNLYVERMIIKGNELFLILNPERPSWAFINRDGMKLLSLFNGIRTTKDISQEIARRYGLKPRNAEKIVESFLKEMAESRIIFDAKAKANIQEYSLKGLTIEVTKQCNLNCIHCCISAGKPFGNELTLEEIKLILDSAKELNVKFICISGGEPLMRPDCMDILDYSTSLGFETTIGTNGTIINTELAKNLSHLPIMIQVSLDGTTNDIHDKIRGKGSHVKVIKGLNNLLSCGMHDRIILSFTPMRQNIKETPALIELALEKKIPTIQFTTLFPAGNARKRWDELNLSDNDKLWLWELLWMKSKELKGKLLLINECLSIDIDELRISSSVCGVGTNLRIDPKGNVYPCQGFIKSSEYYVGSLRKQTLKEIVNGNKLKEILMCSNKRPSMIEKCRNCLWRGLCGSGCMASVYERKKTIWSTDSCNTRKQWIKKMFEFKTLSLKSGIY